MALLIRVVQGDIAGFDGDGVVNAANNHLRMGAGVAGALLAKGGPTIQEECDAHVRAHGPLALGEAAVTGGGNLPARWVIHAAAMGDAAPTSVTIRGATRRSLQLAAEHGMSSVTFPVLGSGVGGFSFSEAARAMLLEIRAHALDADLPEVVSLYGYRDEDAATLRRLAEGA